MANFSSQKFFNHFNKQSTTLLLTSSMTKCENFRAHVSSIQRKISPTAFSSSPIPFSQEKDKLKAPFYIHWECIFMKIYCLQNIIHFLPCLKWLNPFLTHIHYGERKRTWSTDSKHDTKKTLSCVYCLIIIVLYGLKQGRKCSSHLLVYVAIRKNNIVIKATSQWLSWFTI